MHRVGSLCVLAAALLGGAPVDAQSLRGSRASIDRMHRQALQHDLHFYETPSGVRKAANGGSLVRLTGNANYELGSVSQPFVLPATRTFVQRLAQQYRTACGDRLVVTSALRPKSQRLANSTQKSVHPTGMAIDLRKPRGGRCLSWLRDTLLALEGEGVIEATEERNPPHFHVAVFPRQYTRYAGGAGETKRLAAREREPEEKPRRETQASSGHREYKVRRGDSIWTIARRSQVSVEQIKRANNLRGSRIVAGQVLLIPDGE